MPCGPILIVDDEAQNLAAMRAILGGEYRMVFAKSGAEAMFMAVKHRPGLVLLDVGMPDMDGYAICRRLKHDPRTADTPVIFVTGRAEETDEAEGFEVGAVDYIVKPVSPCLLRARVRTHLSLVRVSALERSYHDAIFMLGEAGHFNDTDTGAHIWRMAAYAGALAMAVGYGMEERQLLELAAPMHDTGKIGIRDSILRKPSPLSADEWVEMRTHTRIGHDILARSAAPVFRLAAEIALRHHEKWDGGGYPDGLSGEAIPLSARIVALADVFDALTTRRPYKEPWPVEKAMGYLRDGAGGHFEPRLVTAFMDILPGILDIKRGWDTIEASSGVGAGAGGVATPTFPVPSTGGGGPGWVGLHAPTAS